VAETFETFVAKERERLSTAREEAYKRRDEIDQEITSIDLELRAIDAYEAAKRPPQSKARTPRTTGRRGKRDTVLQAVKDMGGATRSEVLDKLSLKGDKKGEQFVSNALSHYKRTGALSLDSGRYTPSAP
jgi:hypothetical protein